MSANVLRFYVIIHFYLSSQFKADLITKHEKQLEFAASSAEERVKTEIEARCQEMPKKLVEKTANEEWMKGKNG